ncbi:MAG: nucleotide-binding protein [Verrucomicrobiota bacterium]
MSDTKQKAYQRLKELLAEAEESATYDWKSSGKSTEWRQSVRSALRRLFGDKCEQLKAFEAVRFGPMVFSTGSPDSVFHEAFMSGVKSATAIIRSAVQEYEDYELHSSSGNERSKQDSPETATRKIFLVHGHDPEIKQSVARFLERLDFEVIILHEQASGGETIIEKFERNSEVSYAVVLLSPDDVGAAKDKSTDLQPRARQNVILELGYFVGKLGRSNVCPLVKGPLEVPSDFHGVVYVPFEGEGWKIHLVKELKHVGFRIDANKAF